LFMHLRSMPGGRWLSWGALFLAVVLSGCSPAVTKLGEYKADKSLLLLELYDKSTTDLGRTALLTRTDPFDPGEFLVIRIDDYQLEGIDAMSRTTFRLAPGTHRVRASYLKNPVEGTKTVGDAVEAVFDAKPAHVYVLSAGVSELQKKWNLRINDVTEEFHGNPQGEFARRLNRVTAAPQ
jgi:hypothetical protein